MSSANVSTISSGGSGSCRVLADRRIRAAVRALAAIGALPWFVSVVPAAFDSVVADLSVGVAARVDLAPPANERSARARLDAIFRAATSFRFEGGPLALPTDRRWFATVPAPSPHAPVLVARRWPGDTVLALWCLAGSEPTAADASPPLPHADLALEPGGSEPARRVWRGTVATAGGKRPALWIERAVADATFRVGALLLPGDAGLGPGADEGLRLELLAALDRLEVDVHREGETAPLPVGAIVDLPELGGALGDADEGRDPWQAVEGGGFTLGLPPGLRARRTDRGVAPPRPVPGGLLWIRGRFRDRDGTAVAVGDDTRAGYVAVVPGAAPDGGGSDLPVGVSDAVRLAAEPFDVAVGSAGVRRASAERWKENGFDGEWLVFRLERDAGRVEIGLPVVAGRKSPALFWIPLTWRGADEPPAAPPIDPASRFGIRFDRLAGSARRDQPWSEGYLTTPGLRIELPRGWWPIVSLRSRDGFPIAIVDADGDVVATLRRLGPGDAPLDDPESHGFEPHGGARRHHAASTFRGRAGEALWVARDGGGFVLAPATAGSLDADAWQRLLDSVRLLRSGP